MEQNHKYDESDEAERTINKRDYFSGMLSGIMIVLFIVACVLCGKIIYDSNHQGPTQKITRQQIQEQVENVSDRKDEVKNDISGSSSISDKVDNAKNNNDISTVLDNDEVIAKTILLENMIDMYYINDVSDEQISEGIMKVS